MSVQDCKARMKEHLKESGLDRKVTDAQLNAWVREFQAAAGDAMTKAQFEARVSEFIENQVKRAQMKDRAARVFMLHTAENATDSINQNIAQWREDFENGKRGVLFKDNPEKMPVEATRAWLLGGSIRAGVESNLSPGVMETSNYDGLASRFHEEIRPIKEEAASGRLDKAFYQELDALDRGTTLGLSKSPEALSYAKAFKVLRDKIFELKQSLNPYLERAQDYLARQFHDQEKTEATPREVWVQKMMERAGQKSFTDKAPIEKAEQFGRIYDRIVDGTWGSPKSDESFAREYNKGGNIFKSQAQGRQIIFNDWQSAYAHFSDFGPGTVFEGIDRVMSKAAKDIATLDKFGPLPQETFNRVTNKVLSGLEGKEAETFEAHIPELQKMFNVANGSQEAPARGRLAVATKAVMTQQYLAKVGGIYHALQDPLLAASLVRDLNGKTLFQNAFDIVGSYARNMVNPEHGKEVMTNMGLFWRSGYSELMNMMGSPSNRPGTVAGLLEKIGSLNLYQRHIDAVRSATASVLTKLLGDQAALEHGALSERMQQGLARYGIGEHEWETIRRTGADELYGHKVLLPENVENMPNDAAENYLRKSGEFSGDGSPSKQTLDRARFQLARKLGAMVNEHTELSSATPDFRQKYFLWGDTTINSPEGALRRMIAQFKAASIVTNDVYRRGYMSGEGPKGDYAGVFQHAIMGMFFAGLAEYAKQFVEEGKTPENPTNPRFVAKMATSSGFSGIFADSILSAAQRGGADRIASSVLGNLAGPIIGTLAEVAGLGVQAVKEKAGSSRDRTLGTGAVSLLQSNTPLMNLWATRAVANYYMWNQLRNFMGPGYLSHLQRTTGQTAGLFSERQSYLFAKPGSQSFVGE